MRLQHLVGASVFNTIPYSAALSWNEVAFWPGCGAKPPECPHNDDTKHHQGSSTRRSYWTPFKELRPTQMVQYITKCPVYFSPSHPWLYKTMFYKNKTCFFCHFNSSKERSHTPPPWALQREGKMYLLLRWGMQCFYNCYNCSDLHAFLSEHQKFNQEVT